MTPGDLDDRLILKFIREPVEPREVESWLQSRFMDSDPERIPVRARRGQRSPEGIVDDLLHRASLAMHSILEEPGHVRIDVSMSLVHPALRVRIAHEVEQPAQQANAIPPPEPEVSRGTGK